MVGTLAKAFLKAASVMPASALKPARISSLFLAATPMPMARFFISPICSSSALGMVKLSRTTLTFLSFRGLAGAAAGFGVVGFVVGLAALVLTGLAGALRADFAGEGAADLPTGLAAFAFTAGWVTGFVADVVLAWAAGLATVGLLRGVLGAVLAGAGMALAVMVSATGVAVVAGLEVMFMAVHF